MYSFIALKEVNKILISGFSSLVDRGQPLNGVMTSPNFPKPYPNNLDIVQKIEVPEGKRIWIRFSDFNLCWTPGKGTRLIRCKDTLDIFDQDGTQLGGLGLGWGFHGGWGHHGGPYHELVVSHSNKVELHFHTETTVAFNKRWFIGWSLAWGE